MRARDLRRAGFARRAIAVQPSSIGNAADMNCDMVGMWGTALDVGATLARAPAPTIITALAIATHVRFNICAPPQLQASAFAFSI